MKRMVRMLILLAAVLSMPAQAAIVFQNLGTGAPPATMGGHTMSAFNQASQAALANLSTTTTIPGSPVPGSLTTSAPMTKRTVTAGWATWSHGYMGPVFSVFANTITLTLPPNTLAFYLYAETNANTQTVTATTNAGTSSGPVSIISSGGATGFGFYSNAGETFSTITITTSDDVFAIGEFAIDAIPPAPTSIPTLSEWGILILMLLMTAIAVRATRTDKPGKERKAQV